MNDAFVGNLNLKEKSGEVEWEHHMFVAHWSHYAFG